MEFEQRYTASLDILGFAEAVEAAESDQRLRRSLNRAFTNIGKKASIYDDLPEGKVKTITIGHGVIMSADHSREGLWSLVRAVVDLSNRLLPLGLLVRGAITLGPLYHVSDKVFGHALEEAQRLTEEVAVVPRVVLGIPLLMDLGNDRKTSEKVKEKERLIREHWLRQDEDGVAFVHSLAYFSLRRQQLLPLEQHILVAEANLLVESLNLRIAAAAEQPERLMQYRWFADYFNHHVPELLGSNHRINPYALPGVRLLHVSEVVEVEDLNDQGE